MISGEIKHVWTVLCEKSAIDQKSNNMSLFNATEQLNFTRNIPVSTNEGGSTPEKKTNMAEAVPMNRELVSLWRRPPGAKLEDLIGEAKVELIDPKGRLLETLNVPLNFQHFRRLRTLIQWKFLPITIAGEYFFRVMLREGKNFEVVTEIPLEVTLKISGMSQPQEQFRTPS